MVEFETEGKVITCKAAVAWAANKPLTIEDVEVAPPKKHEIRIKILYNGLCHSDAYLLSGRDPTAKFPVILGHEGSGIVESIGEGVHEFAPGDHVIPFFLPQCRACKHCLHPDSNLCDEHRTATVDGLLPDGLMSDGTSRYTCKGQLVYNFLGVSSFAQYAVVSIHNVAKIDEKAPLEKVCLIGCGISTGYGAAMQTSKVRKGSRVAVWGLGAVGLATVMGAHVAGARQIVAIDVNPAKFEAAKVFGATHFVNPKTDCPPDVPFQQWLVENYDGGFDYTFECCGHVATMRQALEASHKGWGVSCIVGLGPGGADISTSPFMLLTGRVWKGTAFGGWKSKDAVPNLVKDYMIGKIKLDEFISHHMPLEDVNIAFDYLKTGECLRSVIHLHDDAKNGANGQH